MARVVASVGPFPLRRALGAIKFRQKMLLAICFALGFVLGRNELFSTRIGFVPPVIFCNRRCTVSMCPGFFVSPRRFFP